MRTDHTPKHPGDRYWAFLVPSSNRVHIDHSVGDPDFSYFTLVLDFRIHEEAVQFVNTLLHEPKFVQLRRYYNHNTFSSDDNILQIKVGDGAFSTLNLASIDGNLGARAMSYRDEDREPKTVENTG